MYFEYEICDTARVALGLWQPTSPGAQATAVHQQVGVNKRLCDRVAGRDSLHLTSYSKDAGILLLCTLVYSSVSV